MMRVFELNLDGLVGPTHHYAGLARGNVASIHNALTVSNPKAAALQGLAKMRLVHELGIKQAILPPHPRPNLCLLYDLGFSGTPAQQVAKAWREAPYLLSACYSASSMWVANAATVSSSIDTTDKRVHFTAANLMSHLHRYQEADFTKKILQRIFSNPTHFQHHPVLPRTLVTSDEGAANHNRLCADHGSAGVSVFVYGRRGLDGACAASPKKYPARQTLDASEAIARAHLLASEKVVFAHQNPKVIDEGVFHHDVIGVANESVLVIHEDAWLDQESVLQEIKTKANCALTIIQIKKKQLTVQEAVSTYFFNSQLLTLPGKKGKQPMVLIAPKECEEHERARLMIEALIADSTNPISLVHYLDLKQSMRNGGGPACLRLRVPLTEHELLAMHQGVVVSESLLTTLEAWVHRHYRSQLHSDDLRDPMLIDESFRALDELSQIIQLPDIFFEQEPNGFGC